MEAPIQRWENERFAREAACDIEFLVPVTTHERDADVHEAATSVAPSDVIALAGRITAGLAVQLLITPGGEDRRAFITLALDGETETFEVAPEHAMDAYRHPFCYGGTLL